MCARPSRILLAITRLRSARAVALLSLVAIRLLREPVAIFPLEVEEQVLAAFVILHHLVQAELLQAVIRMLNFKVVEGGILVITVILTQVRHMIGSALVQEEVLLVVMASVTMQTSQPIVMLML